MELITILVTVVGVAVALGAGVGVPLSSSLRELRRDVGRVAHDIGDLRERMARLEGLFEGYSGAKAPKPA